MPHSGTPPPRSNRSQRGTASNRSSAHNSHMEAASVIDGTPCHSGAPLGVGGGGASPGSGRHPVRAPGEDIRKPKTGDVVPSANGRYSVTLGGKDRGKAMRCSGALTLDDARKVMRSLSKQTFVVGRRVIYHAAGSTATVIPRASADQTRAVLRWTRTTIGRPVGIRWVRRSLKEFGLWSGVEKLAKCHDAKEKRRKAK